jgi:hypothetical protein
MPMLLGCVDGWGVPVIKTSINSKFKYNLTEHHSNYSSAYGLQSCSNCVHKNISPEKVTPFSGGWNGEI